jgi:hypothetical protein
MRKLIIMLISLVPGTIYAQPAYMESRFQSQLTYDHPSETSGVFFVSPGPGTLNNSILKMDEIDSLRHSFKNNIYPEVGYWLIGGSVTINYERMIFQTGKISTARFFLRAGYGYWAFWTGGGPAGILAFNIVLFNKAHHLETGPGIVVLYDNSKNHDDIFRPPDPNEQPHSWRENIIYTPEINIGYRYQKPGKHFIFRIGLSYPEGVYSGLGISF